MGKRSQLQLQVYYGEGKGKTTAALGQALRAWGKGWSILFVQFLKESGAASGEIGAAKKLGRKWRLLRGDLPCPVLRPPRRGEKTLLKRETGILLERAIAEAASGRYDAVVFDEVLAAWKLGLLGVSDLKRAIAASRVSGVRLLVFTGRWAPKSIIGAADLVTEIVKVKHPYDRGGRALEGIDY